MNEILDSLRTILSTSLTGRGIKTFFIGPQAIPKDSQVPMVTIEPVATRQNRSGTVRDDVEYDFRIEVYLSIKQYFDNTNGQGNKIDALEALVDICEERETDGDAKANTIIGILNNNLTLGSKVLYNDNVDIQYDGYYEPGEFPIARATITFTAYDRPNRQ